MTKTMNADKNDAARGEVATTQESGATSKRAPYEPPRIEKRRSVARVTLLSGMGQMGVGVIGMMP